MEVSYDIVRRSNRHSGDLSAKVAHGIDPDKSPQSLRVATQGGLDYPPRIGGIST